MDRPKSGKEFEELVTWVQQCLHDRAVITPNEKIADIHSKRLRQIDIAIRIKDGPTSFLGIVEIRDRSRPVGEDFIEQVNSKRESVGADAAFIVSASGFCKPAIVKARALNIRVFTYQEAVASNWMRCLCLTEVVVMNRKWDKVNIGILDPSHNAFISPHSSIVEALRIDLHSRIFFSEQGEPKFSLPEIASMAINQNLESFFAGISVRDRVRRRYVVNLDHAGSEIHLFFRDKVGSLRKLECFCLDADFWVEAVTTPVQLSRFSNAGTGEALAEVASATVEMFGGQHKLQFITKSLGNEGSKLMVRVLPQNQSK